MTTISVTIVPTKKTRCPNYLATIPNTPDGLIVYAGLRKAYRESGRPLRAYGRGPRHAAFKDAAQNPQNWEHGVMERIRPENLGTVINRHYRPKIKSKFCTHFDVYFR